MTARGQLPVSNSRLPNAFWKLGRSWALVPVVVIALSVAGCGKKGAPLPPFVRVPAAVSQLTAHRVGDDVILSLALPVQNIDQSMPVSLGRVDVYAYTGRTAPSPARFLEVAQRVGMIEATPETPAATTLRDTLTPDELVEGPAVTADQQASRERTCPTGR